MDGRDLRGVTVAPVLPFGADGAIDWQSYERVLDFCASPEGITATMVNGHAGEGATLCPSERIEVIRATRSFLGDTKPILAGIIAFSTSEAIQQARDAEAAGADAVVLFPPPQFDAGAASNPDVSLAYLDAILDAIGIPVSIFQLTVGSGAGFSTDILERMAAVPRVIAIKEGSGNMRVYEDNWRRLKRVSPSIAVLPTAFDWFLSQLAVGADGMLTGLASLTPTLMVDLWKATEAGNLAAMRAANDRLYPVVRAIYGAPPLLDMHTRIKCALAYLGVIACANPRAPLLPLSEAALTAVRDAVDQADLRGATSNDS